MTTLEEFIESEEKQMNWLDKLFMNYPKMYNTKQLADLSSKFKAQPIKVIKPSIVDKTISVFALIYIYFYFGSLCFTCL